MLFLASPRRTPVARGMVSVGLAWLALSSAAYAAEPDSLSVSEASPTATFTAGPFYVSDPVGVGSLDPSLCANCDTVTVNVNVPDTYATAKLRVAVTMQEGDDVDVYVDGTPSAANTENPEVVEIPLPAGVGQHQVDIRPWLVTGSSVGGQVSLILGTDGGDTGGGDTGGGDSGSGDNPGDGTVTGEFAVEIYQPGSAYDNGEPTLGVNFDSGNVLYISGFDIIRATFDDSVSPASVTWRDVSHMYNAVSLDPLLFTDPDTGRTFSSQLIGANSLFAFTDDDGDTWTPGQIAPPNGGADHQGIGGGRYPEGSPFEALAKANGYVDADGNGRAVYYCSQSVGVAFCARSDDGGLTFGPGIPMRYIGDGCSAIGALHGHPQVAPDGTVYVPFKFCDGVQMLARSLDAGLTWEVKRISTATVAPSEGSNDPHVGIATDGTLYVSLIDGNGTPWAAVSTDRGDSWKSISNVGAAWNIKNAVFPQATAGDPDRGAVAFLGTQTSGNSESTDFQGVWHLYIATTYDQGATWETIRATDDPIQGAGGICTSGTTCGVNRNLLDFNDMVIDADGRVLVGLADGCVDDCALDPIGNAAFSARATIARQTSGKKMFAGSDQTEPTVPTAPVVSGTRNATQASLNWSAPFNGGSAITQYTVYRGQTTGELLELGTTTEARYLDTSVDENVPVYYYQVSATNAQGESDRSAELALSVSSVSEEAWCVAPGVEVATDASNDAVTQVPGHDVLSVSMAEPYDAAAPADVLSVTLEVSDLSVIPPNTIYYVYFKPAGQEIVHYVQWDTDALVGGYELGHIQPDPNTGVGNNTQDATITGSTDAAAGTITWTFAKSLIAEVEAGADLKEVQGEARALIGVLGTGLVSAVDSSEPGIYQQKGNASCAPNTPPTALLSVSPQSGTAPLMVTLDASASSDPDGDGIASYRFDFGDGTAVLEQASPTVQYEYPEGAWQASVSVVDQRGLSSVNANNFVVIEVSPASTGGANSDSDGDGVLDEVDNCPTIANADQADADGDKVGDACDVTVSLSASPAESDVDSGDVSLTATVDNPLNGTLSYSFYFGDGQHLLNQETATVSHAYPNAGTYTATVVVVEDGKNSASATTSIKRTTSVTVEPGPAPVVQADLVIVAEGGFQAPATLVLDASGSQAPADSTYCFDFGDGSLSDDCTQATLTHEYVAAGTYSAVVTVASPDGTVESSAQATITIVAADATTAQLVVSPRQVTVGDPVTLDASNSFAASGRSIVEYAFDFGDGRAPIVGTASSVTRAYAKAGTWEPSVTVKDDAGATFVTKASVEVLRPAAAATPAPTPAAAPVPAPVRSSGSGSLNIWMLLMLGLLGWTRRRA